jgi:hypothetical protein
MRKSGMALLVGGLLLGATGSMAQELASAVPAPKGKLMVFADKGHALSPTALVTVHEAAREARQADRVTLTGQSGNVAAVKSELVRQGVPADSIVVRPQSGAPIARVADGLSDPSERRVEIRF